jgi:hypothetical protein
MLGRLRKLLRRCSDDLFALASRGTNVMQNDFNPPANPPAKVSADCIRKGGGAGSAFAADLRGAL